MDLRDIGKRARAAEPAVRRMTTAQKNDLLLAAAEALVVQADRILAANALDMDRARRNNMAQGLQDRLLLTADRIGGMAEGLRQVAALDDPVGEVIGMKRRPNGLLIGQKRVPLGVIGIIYEARPNVTADAFALTFKTGNVVILKGGSDAIDSNRAIVEVLRETLDAKGLPADAILFIDATDRETTHAFMQMDAWVDVLIPRGSAGLIRSVKENSSIPVIETGTGNCHVYIDESADLDMAVAIILNAKTQRIGVCNACESLVIHKAVLPSLMPRLAAALLEKNVEIRADEDVLQSVPEDMRLRMKPAEEDDWGREYLDLIVSAKTVSGIDEAIAHINRFNTKHSEAIVTENYANAQKFLEEIDAAAVYVNASTRFTDGFEFGFGAEIGISTQKLHVRGPMGLTALTTSKYIIYGSGQVRG